MQLKKYHIIILISITILFQMFVINTTAYEQIKNSDIDELSFKQEIQIPIETSLEISKYQPIDTQIIFSNPCWAKDETTHSVRVCYDLGSGLTEIESQIYDLEYCDETHIQSCNIVFLIPFEADGDEKYYVLYDSMEKLAPEYEDHLFLEDSHYFYEPISGQKIDLDYYGIWDSNDVVYSIIQRGELLGSPTGQGVLKFLPGSKKVETYNIDQLGLFDIEYGVKDEPLYYGSSFATDIKKTVLVDGNLMIRVRVEGVTSNGELKSDNIYTYYHQPDDTKKIFIDAYHEVLKDIQIQDPSVLDGTYGSIISIKCRSSSIDKMNAGDLLPSLEVYGEDGNVQHYDVPVNPSSTSREIILSTQDDIDLGERSWLSLSNPETGKTHGLILEKSTGLLDDEDGVQIKSWVRENVKLPGLEAETGNLYVSRNSYDKGSSHDGDLKKGFRINLKMEFLTFESGGYILVDQESDVFKQLVGIKPVLRENFTEEKQEETERFSLKCYVHMAPSIPVGTLLSAATGKKFSYIYAELYKQNNFKSSGSVGRLSLGAMDFDLSDKKFFEKIETVVGFFDIRNTTFFKKIMFPDLEPGVYVVKIFRENSLFGSDHKYIGYGVVDVSEDTVIRIFCKPESNIIVTVLDQYDHGIEDVNIQLLDNDVIISDGVTDINGSIGLKAPMSSSKNPYNLRVLYNGFIIEEKNLDLGFINTVKPKVLSFSVNLFKLNVKILDSWGLKPEVDVNPRLTSPGMFESVSICPEKIDNGLYEFNGLSSADYVLKTRYKSFETEDEIKVDDNLEIDLILPAEYTVYVNFMDKYASSVNKGVLNVYRSGQVKTFEVNKEGEACFKVPPGRYKIELKIDDEAVAYQYVDVKSDKTIDIVTNEDSFIHNAMIVIGVILAIASFVFMFFKRNFIAGLKLLVIALLIVSVFMPWWSLSGEKNDISTSTITMLYPSKIVSFTTTDTTLAGSVSVLPDEFTLLLGLLTVITSIVIFISIITIFSEKSFRRTTFILSITSFVLLIAAAGLFYYAMSMVTELGVGDFMGSGEILTSIPGYSQSETLSCSWGPGPGFILVIISAFVILLIMIYSFVKSKKI